MDVATWLRGLGLGQYAQLFLDNDIDSEILRGMTAEDLKELGISSFGHRRKLFNAIAALGPAPPTRDAGQFARGSTSAPVSPASIDAERRQLTVMFCNLVGSTALSTRFDPEDLRELIGNYHRAVADTVGRFDGFVAKYMGDGVLIYFGYPHAHEDDAERAVRAGLAVIEAVGRLPARQDLQVRLGVATGLAVVGDLRDGDEIALLSELLSLPSSATHLRLSPQRKRERLCEALLNQLEAEARHRPVLMVFEDAHWGDPTSRELLDLTVDRVRQLSVLLVITFRPEFQPPWSGRAQVTSLSLNRLGERDGAALVRKLAGSTALTPEIITESAERTDGVPLFVEELTKAVLENAAQGDRGVGVLGRATRTAQSVPATLHASLMARLDRLGPAPRQIAQIGAVLGREFAYELIKSVAQRPERELQVALDLLSDAGLLFCRGTAPHATYLFKHALVQDAAYATLLRGRLQELHARTAATLEEHFADLVERQPELLAHHLTAAGTLNGPSINGCRAGQHAAEHSAHREAIGPFNRGLTSLGSLPETAERDRKEVEFQLANGASLIMANGFASPDAAQAYTRARDLCEKQGDTFRLLVALFGLWNFARTSDFDAARNLSHGMLVLTRNHDDIGLRLQAHHAAWTTNFFRGKLFPGRTQCEEGRRLYDFERHRSHAMLYGGHDPGVCARSIAGFTNWLIGYPDQSLASGTDAVALAERLGHPFTLGITLLQATVLDQLRREPGAVLQRVDAAEAVAAEQRLSLHIDFRVLRGGALFAQGAGVEAVAMIREGLNERNRAGAKLYRPFCLALFAETLEGAGEHESALAALSEALALAHETGERWWQGVSLLSQNCLIESEASFQRSIRIAQAQQAKSLELRAVRDLARLRGEQGRRAEARDLLAPVYGWFTEGLDTADLKETKALLDELR